MRNKRQQDRAERYKLQFRALELGISPEIRALTEMLRRAVLGDYSIETVAERKEKACVFLGLDRYINTGYSQGK